MGVVDFKMLKRKLLVKTLNGKSKALEEIEKGLSNKDTSKKYGVPPNTISIWIKNKEKFFKALQNNCPSKKPKLRESDFEKQCCVLMVLVKTESKHSNRW